MGLLDGFFGIDKDVAGMRQIAGTGKQMYQNLPGIYNQYANIYQTGGRNAMFDANQREAEGDINAYYQQALARLMTGMGDTNSLQRQNATIALQRGRAQDMSKFRVQNMQGRSQLALQALQSMLGIAQGGGQMGMQGYGQAAQTTMAPWNTMLQLGEQAAMMGLGGGAGAAGAGAGVSSVPNWYQRGTQWGRR